MFCGTGAACNMPQQTNIVVGGILSCCHYHSKRGHGSHSWGIASVPVTLGPTAATTKSASQYFKSTLQDVPKWVAAHKISAHNTYKGVIKAGERNVKSCTIFMLASLHKPVLYLCLYWRYVWCKFRFLHFPQRLSRVFRRVTCKNSNAKAARENLLQCWWREESFDLGCTKIFFWLASWQWERFNDSLFELLPHGYVVVIISHASLPSCFHFVFSQFLSIQIVTSIKLSWI